MCLAHWKPNNWMWFVSVCTPLEETCYVHCVGVIFLWMLLLHLRWFWFCTSICPVRCTYCCDIPYPGSIPRSTHVPVRYAFTYPNLGWLSRDSWTPSDRDWWQQLTRKSPSSLPGLPSPWRGSNLYSVPRHTSRRMIYWTSHCWVGPH
jgi:hypothetical protein